MDDPVAICADASIAWHDAWLRSFGLRTARDDYAWRLLDPAPLPWYFSAITRRPEAPATALAAAHGTVCDSWSCIDLEPFGFERGGSEPWFLRQAGPLGNDAMPPELEILRATTPEAIEEFEAVSVRGFVNERATIEPGAAHPPTILADRDMTSWIGRVEGKPVAAAMSYRTEHAIGIFGVTTIASARRRGYGTGITRAAILPDSGLPAVLAPSRQAERMYERLGFRQVGELQMWSRS